MKLVKEIIQIMKKFKQMKKKLSNNLVNNFIKTDQNLSLLKSYSIIRIKIKHLTLYLFGHF